MTVYEGEEYLGSQGGMNVNESGWPTACAGIAQVELTYPYNSGSDYFIEASHSVSNVQVPQQANYYDPYGFYQFLSEDPDYFPVGFNFMGTGYPSGQDLASVLLGFTFSILHQGVVSSVPHHLQVLNDTDVIRIDGCGQKEKGFNSGLSINRTTLLAELTLMRNLKPLLILVLEELFS